MPNFNLGAALKGVTAKLPAALPKVPAKLPVAPVPAPAVPIAPRVTAPTLPGSAGLPAPSVPKLITPQNAAPPPVIQNLLNKAKENVQFAAGVEPGNPTNPSALRATGKFMFNPSYPGLDRAANPETTVQTLKNIWNRTPNENPRVLDNTRQLAAHGLRWTGRAAGAVSAAGAAAGAAYGLPNVVAHATADLASTTPQNYDNIHKTMMNETAGTNSPGLLAHSLKAMFYPDKDPLSQFEHEQTWRTGLPAFRHNVYNNVKYNPIAQATNVLRNVSPAGVLGTGALQAFMRKEPPEQPQPEAIKKLLIDMTDPRHAQAVEQGSAYQYWHPKLSKLPLPDIPSVKPARPPYKPGLYHLPQLPKYLQAPVETGRDNIMQFNQQTAMAARNVYNSQYTRAIAGPANQVGLAVAPVAAPKEDKYTWTEDNVQTPLRSSILQPGVDSIGMARDIGNTAAIHATNAAAQVTQNMLRKYQQMKHRKFLEENTQIHPLLQGME